jgi:hypothetical protein
MGAVLSAAVASASVVASEAGIASGVSGKPSIGQKEHASCAGVTTTGGFLAGVFRGVGGEEAFRLVGVFLVLAVAVFSPLGSLVLLASDWVMVFSLYDGRSIKENHSRATLPNNDRLLS